jgi:hypothetical protein
MLHLDSIDMICPTTSLVLCESPVYFYVFLFKLPCSCVRVPLLFRCAVRAYTLGKMVPASFDHGLGKAGLRLPPNQQNESRKGKGRDDAACPS